MTQRHVFFFIIQLKHFLHWNQSFVQEIKKYKIMLISFCNNNLCNIIINCKSLFYGNAIIRYITIINS